MRQKIGFFLVMLMLASRVHGRPMVVAYVPNWIDLPAFAATIDYAKVTHLNIAFENPDNDAGELTFNADNAALITKAHAHQVKVLVSIGGGSAAEDKTLRRRYANLLGEKNRGKFVAGLAAYVTLHGFDGLDVDLEGPSVTADYAVFIKELAAALKPGGKLLTAALSKGYGGEKVPVEVFGQLDFVNLMAYDAVGYWDPNTPGQHSSLAFARETLAWWLARGLPKGKAVLGVPFYGYGFGQALRKGEYSYREIVTAHAGAENADEVEKTIWYNGLATIKNKAREVVEQGLGGVMIWSLDSDVHDQRSLLGAIDAALNSPAEPAAPADDWVYLDNGKLRVGVLRSSGGAIAFLARSGSERNFLNHFDRGRLIQQSYYGDEDGSFWDKKPWRYNPVQGGDFRGKSPRLLELRAEANSLYTRSEPRHWASGAELPECVMEQWVTLEGSVVHVRFQMTYNGSKVHAARHQEIPAIFVDASLATLVTYAGEKPWTGEGLNRRSPGAANEYLKMTENWVAYVDAKDVGLGAYVPAAAEATCYRFRGGAGSDCSYVAPIATFSLKPGLIFGYDAYFAIGSIAQLREQFAAIHAATKAK